MASPAILSGIGGVRVGNHAALQSACPIPDQQPISETRPGAPPLRFERGPLPRCIRQENATRTRPEGECRGAGGDRPPHQFPRWGGISQFALATTPHGFNLGPTRKHTGQGRGTSAVSGRAVGGGHLMPDALGRRVPLVPLMNSLPGAPNFPILRALRCQPCPPLLTVPFEARRDPDDARRAAI